MQIISISHPKIPIVLPHISFLLKTFKSFIFLIYLCRRKRRVRESKRWAGGRQCSMPTGISIEITSPLRHLLFMPQSLDSEHMHKQADTHQGPQISYYNFLEEIRRVERKLSVFKIREANKHHCSANVCFPRWLSEVAPQALTCLDKGGSQWLSLCPEALSISHKLGLSVCLRKSHDSS